MNDFDRLMRTQGVKARLKARCRRATHKSKDHLNMAGQVGVSPRIPLDPCSHLKSEAHPKPSLHGFYSPF